MLFVCAVLLLSFHWIFGAYFPTETGRLGHDYVLGLPGLLDGYLWYHQNGFLSIPWFTPSFCGGQAYHADPQSGYWSLPQVLTLLLDPLAAYYVSHLIMAGAGFIGMALLCRRTFGLSLAGTLAAATVFMFNGFFSHRMIVGHTGFQAFMLVPLAAYLLTAARDLPPWRRADLGLALLTGLLVAYWLHSGLTTLMVPAGLAVLALAAMLDLRRPGALWIAVRRGLIASLTALLLSASKLVASAAMILRFPRTSYPLPGFDNPGDLLQVVFGSLFYSSQHAYETARPLWRNMQWAALPHEMAFGVTLVPLALMLIALGLWLLEKARRTPERERRFRPEALFLLPVFLLAVQLGSSKGEMGLVFYALVAAAALGLVLLRPLLANLAPGLGRSPVRRVPLLVLALIFSIPLMMLFYSPNWNALLKSLPLVGSTTSPLRWTIVFIPLLALWTGQVVDRFRSRAAIGAVVVLSLPLLNALEDRSYYLDQATYDPAPVVAFYQAVRQGETVPAIHTIADARSPGRAGHPSLDGLVRGESPLQCYNPLFGYRLERFVPEPLREGPITDEVGGGYLNIRNPACLLYPAENGCKPWDAFRMDQRADAFRFAAYQPIPFKVSWVQVLANALSLLALGATLGVLLWVGVGLARERLDRRRT